MKESEKLERTPGPWKAVPTNDWVYGPSEQGWGIIAVEPMRGRIDSQITGLKRADAEFIVASCNGRDALEAQVAQLNITMKALAKQNTEVGESLTHCEYASIALLDKVRELQDALRWLLDSIPHLEGDDNLTEPIAKANSALIGLPTSRNQREG